MATLFLMVGLPGSGKTTLAQRIERAEAALRLTPDEWIATLGFDPHDVIQRARIESLQWAVASRALQLGVHVILDFGFWSRRERDDFRARAQALGAHTELRFLDVPRRELKARLAKRHAAEPSTAIPISDAQLDQYLAQFEPPSAEELREDSRP